MFKRKKA